MPRSINSTVITFGLVSIPAKVYTAASAVTESFCMLTPDGNRIKQKYEDAVTGKPVEYKDLDRGYEVAKDEYVRFSKEEVKALEAEKSDTLDIKEFVDADSFDAVQVEKSYYLGPDKGGDRAYQLLSSTMRAMGKVAVAQWAIRGKEQLVVLRPYKNGMVLHQMFYANEVRDFEEIEMGKMPIHDAEREMAAMLVQSMATGVLAPEKYEDGFMGRVKMAVDRKMAGIPNTAPAAAPKKSVGDLLEALKASIAATKK